MLAFRGYQIEVCAMINRRKPPGSLMSGYWAQMLHAHKVIEKCQDSLPRAFSHSRAIPTIGAISVQLPRADTDDYALSSSRALGAGELRENAHFRSTSCIHPSIRPSIYQAVSHISTSASRICLCIHFVAKISLSSFLPLFPCFVLR